MVGVRNPLKNNPDNPWLDAGTPECAIVWINELRLTDFVSEGGSAAIAQMQVQRLILLFPCQGIIPS